MNNLTATAPDASGLNEAALQQLWNRWHRQRDAEARELLISHHMVFAKTVAATYYGKRVNNEIEFADYLQWATLGMIESLDRFDPEMGFEFKTFASHRMRGAILDGITSSSDKQQQIALRRRLRQERMASLKSHTQQPQEQPPSAAALPTEELFRYLADIGIGLALGWLLEDTGMVACQDPAVEVHQNNPYLQTLHLKQVQEKLHGIVDQLPAQQRMVIRYHYLQGFAFEQVAQVLHLTKGRISQIHKLALNSLRDALHEHV